MCRPAALTGAPLFLTRSFGRWGFRPSGLSRIGYHDLWSPPWYPENPLALPACQGQSAKSDFPQNIPFPGINMTIRPALGVFALALCSFFLGSMNSARAVDGPLDQVGGVCVPDGATIRAGLYETRGFGIGFSGSKTGTIRLLCPFNATGNLIGTRIGITFLSVIDGDGIAEGARVQAIFRHAALGSNVAITNNVCDSNTSNLYGTAQHRLLFSLVYD